MKLSQYHLRLWLERQGPEWAKRENIPRDGIVSGPPVSLIQRITGGQHFSAIDAIINERAGKSDSDNDRALFLMRLMRTNAEKSRLGVSYYAREAISAGGKNNRRDLMILRWMHNLDKRDRA